MEHGWIRGLAGAALLLAGQVTAGDFDHTRFDELLTRYARDGRLLYGRLRGERQGLDEAAQALNLVDPGELAGGDAQKAFWINGYNLLVIRALVDAQPVSRVTDVPGFFEEPRHPVGGEKYSLDRILDEELRKKFSDPRVLFAVANGSASGPAVPERAFRAEGLDEALTASTRAYLAREDTVSVDSAGKIVHVSPLFEKYAADFVTKDEPGEPQAALRKFLIEHGPAPVKAALEPAAPYTIKADLPYDWTLNDRLLARKRRFVWPWAREKAGSGPEP